MDMDKPVSNKNVLVDYVSKIIEKYKKSAMCSISEHCDCCEEEEIQALDEECWCLINEFEIMLNRR